MASDGNDLNDAGCFPWMRRRSSSSTAVTNSNKSSAKRSKQPIFSRKSSGDKEIIISRPKELNSPGAASTSKYSASLEPTSAGVEPPSTGAYAFEAGKQTIEVLQRFANMLPVPCANEVLEVALLLMTTYEDVTVLEEQVKDLNNRIGSLMLVMVDGLTGKEATTISPDVVRDIEKLGGDLRATQKDLAKITSQSRWLLVFFKSANRATVDACLGRLNDALQSFNVSRAIRDGNMLFEIQTRLETVNEVTGKMAEKVDKMYSWLLDKDAHGAQSNLVLEEMPIPVHLYGRDGVISNIAKILTTKTRPRVGILGAGGMGKTSVAVAVMENEMVGKKYQASHRFWVPCVGVTSPITFLQILSKSFRVNQDTGELLKDILYTLKSTQEPRLVLLDNLETAMSVSETVTDGGRLSTEGIINQFASVPHVAILVTVRSNALPSDTISWDLVPLEGVAREDARAIFTSICPTAADHPSLDALLEVLGYMPYAVTLMAKQAVHSFAQLDTLLEEWKKSGTNSLSRDLKEKMNRSIELSVESKAISGDSDAQCLLAILGQLPSGTNLRHLKWWANRVEHVMSAIGTLNNTALIIQRREGASSPTFFVLPVVQSYLHEQPLYNSSMTRRVVLEACCSFVLDHKSSPGDPNFKAHLEELDIEKTNIQAILHGVKAETLTELGLAESICNVFDAMLAFAWYQFWTKRSSETLIRLLELAPSSNIGEESILRYISQAHACLGRVYLEFGRYSDACETLEVARREFHELGTPTDRIRAGDSALYLADTWCVQGRPGREIERLVRQAQEELSDDPKGSARALMQLGDNYWYRENYADALEILGRAKESLITLGCTAEVAECLICIARCHAKQGDLEEWLKTGKEALRLSKLVGKDEKTADALQMISRCYIRMGKYDDALVTLKEAAPISEKLGGLLPIAHLLELSGYAYARNDDLLGAKIAYEAAKKKYDEMEETNQIRKESSRCEENLQKIEEGDMELEVPMLY
ncbi:hypothetical protein FRC18_003014 [Serendipita sp. 400]|nr:hypothetical protein FRC18_003014 [Serendipita sp. 400]